MFDLTSISTTNLFTAVQILVVVFGFYFSVKSLKATQQSITVASQSLDASRMTLELATKNAQAQLFNHMVTQGRDLGYKYMEMYYGGDSPGEVARRKNHLTGMVIAYYASCFELRRVVALPESMEKLLQVDLREFMRDREVREKWDEVKSFHSKEFGQFVDSVRAAPG
jgi:hypothetical protein